MQMSQAFEGSIWRLGMQFGTSGCEYTQGLSLTASIEGKAGALELLVQIGHLLENLIQNDWLLGGTSVSQAGVGSAGVVSGTRQDHLYRQTSSYRWCLQFCSDSYDHL